MRITSLPPPSLLLKLDERAELEFEERWTHGHFALELPRKQELSAAAWVEEKLAGYVVVSETERGARVHRLVVAPEHRGQGVATALVAVVPRPAEVVTHPGNLAALRVYKRSGFVPVETTSEGRLLLTSGVDPGVDKSPPRV